MGGAASLVSKHRGRPSNNRLPEARTGIGVEGQNGVRTGAMANAAALGSLSLFLLSARSADRKKNLHFGRRGGVQSGLLKEPCLSSLLLSLARRLEGCSLGSLRWRLLRRFSRYRLASDPLAFRDPDVAGCDDLQSSLYSLQPSGIIRSGPSALNLSLPRSAGST